jgi:Icc protein
MLLSLVLVRPAAGRPAAEPARDLTRRAIAALPRPPADGTFRFAVMGDNRGNYEVLRQLIVSANREQPSLMVNTGDLVAEGRLREYLRFLAVIRQSHGPYFTVVGNHDVTGNGLLIYRQLFGEENYAFDYAGCRFVMLDNSRGQFPEERLQWLDTQLDTPLRKFVFMHKPPPVGTWGAPFAAAPWRENADRFVALVSRRRVDRVFVGHIHTYGEREIGGVRYVLTGGAGAPLAPSPHAYFHYVLVSVSPSGIQDQVVRLRPL